jgi:P4 family phage/plasmid primase-like protien
MDLKLRQSASTHFFLYGTGANGKSVFLFIISALLGDYAKTASTSSFTANTTKQHPTDLAGLRGARFVTAAETEDGAKWAESKIKSLTGSDKISARLMRCDFFEFLPEFKLIIASNHKPSLRSVDEAIRRRLHLVRQTLASYLVRTKTDPKTVQTPLRHANVKTTLQLYAHSVSEDRLAAQGQALAAFLQPPATDAVKLIMGGSWVEGNYMTTAKLKKEMVGTRRLELLTSTVSILRSTT